MFIQKEGYDSMRGNAQKIQIQINKFSKERSCTSYLTILRKTKVWIPLESSQVVRTQPKIPLIKTSYQQLWLWKDSCTVVLCYNCPACNGSVTDDIIILPQKLLLRDDSLQNCEQWHKLYLILKVHYACNFM